MHFGLQPASNSAAAPFNILTLPGLYDLFDGDVAASSTSWTSQVGTHSVEAKVGTLGPTLLTNRVNGHSALSFASASLNAMNCTTWGMNGQNEWTFVAVISFTALPPVSPGYVIGTFGNEGLTLAIDGSGNLILGRNSVHQLVVNNVVGSGPRIIACRASSDGGTELYIDGISRGTLSNTATACQTFLTLGYNAGSTSNYADFEIAYLVNVNQRLSQTNFDSLHAFLRARFALAAPKPQFVVTISGHSYVFGVDATPPQTMGFAPLVQGMLDPNIFQVTHLGHSGFRTGNVGTDPLSTLYPLAAAEVDTTVRHDGFTNMLVYAEELNSITFWQAGSPPAATVSANTITDMTAYFTARRPHWDLVGNILMTPEAAWPVQYQGCTADVNSAMASGLGGLVNFVIDPTGNTAYLNDIYIASDGIHPKNPGHLILANYVVAAVKAQYTLKTGIVLP